MTKPEDTEDGHDDDAARRTTDPESIRQRIPLDFGPPQPKRPFWHGFGSIFDICPPAEPYKFDFSRAHRSAEERLADVWQRVGRCLSAAIRHEQAAQEERSEPQTNDR